MNDTYEKTALLEDLSCVNQGLHGVAYHAAFLFHQTLLLLYAYFLSLRDCSIQNIALNHVFRLFFYMPTEYG
ncbi:hypothetical protein YYU_03050 [Anaplasma phagocytophilum str. HZ2]|nr:hypothetical protein YYU_03050 [Anaplasma phagocytophilum str. HZ2]AGR80658.1 hypothetical protein WSQ_03050 [Anaplasma phagocytophilum str. JM]AGR81914.1 hypothetical protein YYY_03055 [Anaplasma phagocytophilum str. Dog2]PLC09885.1 hypothetical protein C0V68_04225 [Anaplasma phagocytophilum]